jgi:hypothetical protein
MACTGHSNVCPTHVGLVPGEPRWPYTDDPLTTANTVKAVHVNDLKDAINAEAARRSIVLSNTPPTVSASGIVNNSHMLELKASINEIQMITNPLPGIVDEVLEDGDDVLAETITALRSHLEVRRSACLCDCNHTCTCDCNHACTCDCNHSCTCNCAYTCTCNCAYSDERLKTEIECL